MVVNSYAYFGDIDGILISGGKLTSLGQAYAA
jgi:hypothetical protein